jgi:hypothetical protein
MKDTFYEYDFKTDNGVSLSVRNSSGAIEFGVTVDGKYLAAYLGSEDIERLMKTLKQMKQKTHWIPSLEFQL